MPAPAPGERKRESLEKFAQSAGPSRHQGRWSERRVFVDGTLKYSTLSGHTMPANSKSFLITLARDSIKRGCLGVPGGNVCKV